MFVDINELICIIYKPRMQNCQTNVAYEPDIVWSKLI